MDFYWVNVVIYTWGDTLPTLLWITLLFLFCCALLLQNVCSMCALSSFLHLPPHLPDCCHLFSNPLPSCVQAAVSHHSQMSLSSCFTCFFPVCQSLISFPPANVSVFTFILGCYTGVYQGPDLVSVSVFNTDLVAVLVWNSFIIVFFIAFFYVCNS